jgi:hypothetical protein
VSAEQSSAVRRRHSSGSRSTVNPRRAVRQRTGKYTIAHDVFFVVSYIKLNCFTCVYLIINLDVSIFTDEGRPATPHTSATEPSGSHSGSRDAEDVDDDSAVGGEVPPTPGTLNAYIFFLSVVTGTINLY